MPRVFVYGAQMDNAADEAVVGAASVEDHAVRFVARGVPVFEPGFAALEAAPGERAYGVVLELEDEAWAELVRFERGYEVAEVEARWIDAPASEGEGTTCYAFRIAAAHRSERELAPSTRYARKLAAGARRHGLPDTVRAHYEHLAATGSSLSLGLVWLFPLASRIGLVPTAILLGLGGGLLVTGFLLWLG